MFDLTLTQSVSIGTACAAVVLWSRPASSILSWNQRASRQRAVLILILTIMASCLFDLEQSIAKDSYILGTLFFCGAGVLFTHHLRESASKWAGGRIRIFMRIIVLTMCLFTSIAAHYYSPVSAILPILAGVFFASIQNREYHEISGTYAELAQKMSSLSAEQKSHRPLQAVSKNHDNLPIAG